MLSGSLALQVLDGLSGEPGPVVLVGVLDPRDLGQPDFVLASVWFSVAKKA